MQLLVPFVHTLHDKRPTLLFMHVPRYQVGRGIYIQAFVAYMVLEVQLNPSKSR
jgi:hypothetical protein